MVVGSTPSVDAVENTCTFSSGSAAGFPVYWLGGSRVADDYADFYDGDWGGESAPRDESGALTGLGSGGVFTGSLGDGSAAADLFGSVRNELGRRRVRLGFLDSLSSGPLSGRSSGDNFSPRPVFALSPPFLLDPDPVVSLSVGSARVAEGGSFILRARASEAPSADLVVPLVVGGASTATRGADFHLAASVTIPAGRETGFVHVQVRDDDLDEPLEVLALSVGDVGGGYGRGFAAEASVAIVDDDATTVSLGVSPAAIPETSGSAVVVVAPGRSLSDGEVLRVGLALSGSARRGADYTVGGAGADGVSYENLRGPGAPAVVFSGPLAAPVSAALSFEAAHDAVDEGVGESVVVALASLALSSPGGDESVSVSASAGGPFAFDIVDDDPPVVSVAAARGRVGEGGEAVFALSAAGAWSGNLVVDVVVADAPAGDFVAPGGEGARTVTFPPGSPSAELRVATVDDGEPDASGPVTVTVLDGAAYEVAAAAAAASVVVVDDDDVGVSLAARTPLVYESGGSGTASVVVSLGRPLVSPERATVTLGLAGAATPGVDYAVAGAAAPGVSFDLSGAAGGVVVVVFDGAAGSSAEAVLSLRALADGVAEAAPESVVVSMTGTATSNIPSGLPRAAPVTVHIADPVAWPVASELTPDGVTYGDSFRLLFVTSTTRDASSGDIGVYNRFVSAAAAAGHAEVRGFAEWFRVLGGTASVAAVENTAATGGGVAVFWLGGDRVADDYGDLFDGSWDAQAPGDAKDQFARTAPNEAPFTGAASDGSVPTAAGAGPLGGGGGVAVGRWGAGADPIADVGGDGANAKPFYALSPVLKVAPASVTVELSAPAGGVAEDGGAKTVSLALSRELSGAETVTVPLTVSGAAAGADFTFANRTGSGVSAAGVAVGGSDAEPVYTFTAGGQRAAFVLTAVDDSDRDAPLVSVGYGAGARAPGASGIPGGVVFTGAASFLIEDDEAGDIVLAAGSPLVPSGVAPGEAFRLVFVTSARAAADSGDIADYDDLVVAAVASGGAEAARRFAGHFKVLGSTAGVSARDHNDMGGAGEAVYWLGGAKAADDYGDLFDGSWDTAGAADATNEAGGAEAASAVFTGSRHDGSASANPLGGGALVSGGGWLDPPCGPLECYDLAAGAAGRFYGLSPVFKVADAGSVPTVAAVGVDSAVVEGSPARFRVAAAPAPGRDTTINVEVAEGPGGDFVAAGGEGGQTLTLTAGTSVGNFQRATVGDGLDEPDGELTVTLRSGVGYTLSSDASAQSVTVRVIDDDPTALTLASGGRSAGGHPPVAEGAHKDFTVTLGRALADGESAVVPLTVSGAEPGRDYRISLAPAGQAGVTLATSGASSQSEPTLTFAAGARAAALRFAALDNHLVYDSAVRVAFGSGDRAPSGLSGGFETVGSLDFAIADDDAETRDVTLAPDSPLVPSGLAAGDRFRLLFITSTVRDAGEGAVANSDAFVRGAVLANGAAALRPLALGFRALVCSDNGTYGDASDDVDANAHTSTTYTADDKGVPVYWLGGGRLADDYEDFYDGSWDLGAWSDSTDETGARHRPPGELDDFYYRQTVGDAWRPVYGPFTGCDDDGTIRARGAGGGPVGHVYHDTEPQSVRSGVLAGALADGAAATPAPSPLSSLAQDARVRRPRYGLSSVLTVGAAAPVPSLSVAGAVGATEGSPASFTVAADRAPAAELAVAVAVGDPPPGDFVASADEAATLRFPAGRLTATFEVPTVADAADEPSAEVTVTLREAPAGLYTVTPVAAGRAGRFTVTDDDATTVTLSASESDLLEGTAACRVVTVTLGRPLVRDSLGRDESLAVPLSFGGAAAYGADYTVTRRPNVAAAGFYFTNLDTADPAAEAPTVHFTTGPGVAEFCVWATGDGAAEGAEALTVAVGPLGAASGANLDGGAAAAGAALSILIADRTTVTVAAASGAVDGGDGRPVSFTLTASPPPQAPLTVRYNVSERAPGKFLLSSAKGDRTVVFPDGAETVTVSVGTQPAGFADSPDGAAVVTLLADAGYSIPAAPGDSASVRINDPRATPLTLSAPAALVAEAGGTADVTVALPRALVGDERVTVPLEVTGAAAGSDYTLALDAAAGSAEGVALSVSGDASAQRPTVTFTAGGRTAVIRYTSLADDDRAAPAVAVRYGVGGRAPSAGDAMSGGVDATGEAVFVVADDDAGDIVVAQNWPLRPASVPPGGRFRLLFVTSTARDASSGDIADYDAFVRGAVAAGGHPGALAYAGHFRALASTAAVAARDHTSTTHSAADRGVGVHWLGGDLVAADYADLYGLAWAGYEVERARTEAGAASGAVEVWTGTAAGGGATANPLGHATAVTRGRIHAGSTATLEWSTHAPANALALYALSPVFTVRPPGVTVTLSAPSGDVAEDGGAKDVTVALSRPLAGAETITVPLTVAGATAGADYTLAQVPSLGSASGVSVSTSAPDSAQRPVVSFSAGGAAAVVRLTAVADSDRLAPAVSVSYGTGGRAPRQSRVAGAIATTGDVSFVITDDDTGDIVVAPNSPLRPAGVGAGGEFRLLLVTSAARDASSGDIADYDAFVRGVIAAGGHPAVVAYTGHFTALAGTAAVAARDHTSTTYTDDDKGVAVYWLVGGAKVADDYEDLYDSDGWDNADVTNVRDESGAPAPTSAGPFTGAAADGSVDANPLGHATAATHGAFDNVAQGRLGRGPIDDGTAPVASRRPFYALSPVLKVAGADAEPTITVTAAAAPATEGATITFLVAADAAPAADVTVNLAVADAAAPSDYLAAAAEGAATVTIAAGRLGAALTVATAADAVDEPDGAVTATVAAGTGYEPGAAGTASVAVRDDDATAVTLSAPGGDLSEGYAATITVELSRPLAAGEALAVPLAFAGEALRGTDYTLAAPAPAPAGAAYTNLAGGGPDAPPTVTFTGGPGAAAAATLTLAAAADGIAEPAGETVRIALGALDAASGVNLGGGAAGTGAVALTIQDPPEVTITGPAAALTEGGDATFTITAAEAPAADITVNVAVGDAPAPSDYLAAAAEGGAAVTIAAGDRAATLTVATAADAVDEPNGGITAAVAPGAGYTPAAGAATATVRDDDATAVTLSAPGGDVLEGGAARTITVELSRPLAAGEALAVPLTVTGAARLGADYTLAAPSPAPAGAAYTNLGSADFRSPPTVTFTGGPGAAAAATLTLAAAADGIAEPAGEAVRIGLGALTAASGRNLGGGAAGTGAVALTIQDPPEVTITGPAAALTEGGAATFTITAAPAPDVDITVNVAVADAPAPSDYLAGAAEGAAAATIAAGDRAAALTVATTPDSADEPPGDITVTLAPGAGYTPAAGAAAAAEVRDDDATAVTLAAPSGDLFEDGAARTVTVELSRALAAGEGLAVPLTFAGGAERGTDYIVGSRPAAGVAHRDLNGAGAAVIFTGAPGASPVAELTITPVYDEIAEAPGETVRIGLGALTASSGVNLGGGAEGAGAAAFTIKDAAAGPGAAAVADGWALNPPGAAVGDTFRLLFVTSTRRDASSADIADYNAFVAAAAAAGRVDLRRHAAGFKAVASTAAVDARDNTGTGPTGADAAIHWLGGAKVADSNSDFYDGTWDDLGATNENGAAEAGGTGWDDAIWTGSLRDGTATNNQLGAANVLAGFLTHSLVRSPLTNIVSGRANTETKRLYALSPVLKVVATLATPTVNVAISAPPGAVAEAGGHKDITIALDRALIGAETLTVPIAATGAVAAGEDFTLTLHPAAQTGVALRTGDPHSAQNPAVTFTAGAHTAVLRYTSIPNDDRRHPAVTIAHRPDDIAADTIIGAVTGGPARFYVQDDETGPITVARDWDLNPPGLADGTRFRLLLKTSTRRDATSTDIADYDAFARDAIADNGHPTIAPYAGHFKVAANTAGTNLQDHLALRPAADGGGPRIHWLGGARIARGHADLCDGAWESDTPTHIRDETARAGDTDPPWTGSDTTCGTRAPLGGAAVTHGAFTTTRTGTALSEGTRDAAEEHSLLAMSPEFRIAGTALTLTIAAPPGAIGETAGAKDITIALGRALRGDETVTVPLTVTGTAAGTQHTLGLHGNNPGAALLDTAPHSAQNPAVRLTAGAAAATLRYTPADNDERTTPHITIDYGAGPNAPTAAGVPEGLGDPAGGPITITVLDDETGEHTIPPDWPLKPAEIGNGETFRLVFATSEKRDAAEPDIGPYNQFVRRAAAAGHADIVPYAGAFNAVACTQTTNARTNTGVDPAADTGEPIHWLAGNKIADDHNTFYNTGAGWTNKQTTDATTQTGTTAPPAPPWTGCDPTGQTRTGRHLGAPTVATGAYNTPTATPIGSDQHQPNKQHHTILAISPTFRVQTPTTPPEVTLTTNPASVAEGDTATFTITVDPPQDTDLTVNITVTQKGDYTATVNLGSQTVTIPANTASAQYTITTTTDTTSEPNGAITIQITTAAATQYTIGVPHTATVTVTDDDGGAAGVTVTQTGGSTTVTEALAGRTDTYTIALDAAPTHDVAVTATSGTPTIATVAKSGATPAAHQTLTYTPTTWAEPQTITITAVDDNIVNQGGTRTATITHTAASDDANYQAITITPVTVTVIDDDTPLTTITLTTDTTTINEDDPATTITITATLSGTTTFDTPTSVAVTIGAKSDTATAGADYTPVLGLTVTIPANAASGTNDFTITPTDDNTDEPDETITISGAANGFTVTAAVITIPTDTADAPPTVSVADATAVAEGDDPATTTAMTFAVTLSAVSGRDVTVDYTLGGTAQAGSDYTEPDPLQVTIPAGGRTADIVIPIKGDAVFEGDETITVTLTNPANATVTGGAAAGTITEDDPATITLTANPAGVSEGDTATTVTVTATISGTATRSSATAVTISVGTNTDTAVSGTDYTAVADFTVTIPANAASGAAGFTLTATDDSLDEPDTESLTIAGAASESTVSGATITIADDDAPPAVSVADAAAVTEGDDPDATTPMTFAVTLGAVSGREVTVDYTLGGTAQPPGDYTAPDPLQVTIPAGGRTADIVIPIRGDTAFEGDETVTVTLTNPTNATVTGGAADGTITEDDPAPEVTLSVNPTSVAEGDTATTVTVTATLDGATQTAATPVTVSVGAAGDAAVSGTDYTAVADFTVTIPANAASGSAGFTLTATDDDLDEPDETITISGTTPNLTVGGATITISVDVSDAPPAVSVADAAAVTEGDDPDATTPMTFAVTLSAASGREVTVDYTLGGTAQPPGDYTAPDPLQVTIPAGDRTADIVIPVRGDTVFEGDETVTVTLTNPTNATVTGGAADGTITEDDPAPTSITLSANPASVAEGDAATTVTVTAALDGATRTADTPVTVSVGAAGDAAVAGSDYTGVADFTVTIPANAASGSAGFTLTPTDDDLDEPDTESLTITGVATGFTVTAAAITIADNDTPPTEATVSFEKATYTADEDDGTINIGVILEKPLTSAAVIRFQMHSATAEIGPGGDVRTPIESITFAPGETRKRFVLHLVDNNVVEPDETVTISLIASSGPVEAGASTTVTLTDDDRATIFISQGTRQVEEGSRGTIDIRISKPHQDEIVLDSVADGTATSGEDYEALSQRIIIPAGSGTFTVTVDALEDGIVEGRETLRFTIENAVGDRVEIAPERASHTMIITEAVPSLPKPEVRIAAAGDITEGGEATFTITADPDPYPVVILSVTVSQSGDFGIATGERRVIVPTGGSVTLTVPTTDDEVDEADGSVTATLNTGDGYTVSGSQGAATVAVTDDDDPPPEVSISEGGDISEGGEATFTITVNPAPSADLPVSVTVSQSGDFGITAGERTVIVPTGGSVTLTVPTTDDEADEADGSVTATLNTGDGYTVSGSQGAATVAVTDDDDPTPPATILISIEDASGLEGREAEVRVTLGSGATHEVRVSWTTMPAHHLTGRALAWDDYIHMAGQIVFAAGETSVTVLVFLEQDSIDELDEVLAVELYNPVGAVITEGLAIVTIIDDD